MTVTPITVPLLFNLLADPSLPIRLATSVALLRIVSKGLKEPGDKLQLLKVLSLGQVLEALEAKTRAQQVERGDDTDEGEESYREALGKLLNVLGQELSKLVEVSSHTTLNCRVPVNISDIGVHKRGNPLRSIDISCSDSTDHAKFPGGRIR